MVPAVKKNSGSKAGAGTSCPGQCLAMWGREEMWQLLFAGHKSGVIKAGFVTKEPIVRKPYKDQCPFLWLTEDSQQEPLSYPNTTL